MPYASISRDFGRALAFACAARSYWLSVFPAVRSEVRRLRSRTRRIPNAELRTLACESLQLEGKNLEGAAAFSAFLPRAHRASVVRAQVAFQAAYDYVDILAETGPPSPANAHQLHRALIVAVSPGSSHADYYRYHTNRRDGGYLSTLIDSCRGALSRLPSYPLIADVIHRNARRIVGYQTRTNLASRAGRHALSRWAGTETPSGANLRWWETAAACGSSLAVLALFAAAADPRLTRPGAEAVEAVYWPWAGALHSLLDSAIDYSEDVAAGRHNLVTHYASPHEMASRLRFITTEADRQAGAIGLEHQLILTGMASLYLSAPQATSAAVRPAANDVLSALGGLAPLTMLIFRTRRLIREPATPPSSRAPER